MNVCQKPTSIAVLRYDGPANLLEGPILGLPEVSQEVRGPVGLPRWPLDQPIPLQEIEVVADGPVIGLEVSLS